MDLSNLRKNLQAFDFRKLFVDDLGWSKPSSTQTTLELEGQPFDLKQVAQLSGVQVFEASSSDGQIPDAKIRKKIHDEVSKQAYENLLIFTDKTRTQSIWYWAKRDGKKTYPRDHFYDRNQSGDLLLSKIQAMFVDIGELDTDGNIPVVDVARKLQAALDVEKTTKKFYKEFEQQHLEFVGLIEGITDERDKAWYASVLLNRLMFIYFLQGKGFVDNKNYDYLQEKLGASKAKAKDLYYSEFLNALFFEGFAKPENTRSAETNTLLGTIKYLNGGLFLPHSIEQKYEGKIRVPDKAFENLLGLFTRYSWNLDDLPGGKDDEINPDVLGYIFEKYINQKAFGAYYTRPEITEYLCERTIYPLILERINEPDVPGLLPGRKFDSIPELLMRLDNTLAKRLLFKGGVLSELKLLDPACGSGAFLIAAMKTLFNVYASAIGWVEAHGNHELKDWLKKQRGGHQNFFYFIKKRIITDNLFGVDLMAEATEIARLRLFLALVSSAHTIDELEPLPNIDFNIQSGNSLIGLLHVDEKEYDKLKPQGGLFSKRYPDIVAERLRNLESYRHAAELKIDDLRNLRDNIEQGRGEAVQTLNEILCDDFGELGIKFEEATWDEAKGKEGKSKKRAVTIKDIEALEPFHWGFEFSEVMAKGGFDAIITNPPWDIFKPQDREFLAEYSDIAIKSKTDIKEFEKEKGRLMKDQKILEIYLEYLSRFPHISAYFRSALQFRHQSSVVNGKKTGTDINLYKLFTEQCINLLKKSGRCGTIIPTGIYTDLGSRGLRELLFDSCQIDHIFGIANERFIFEGVDHRFKFSILTFEKGSKTEQFDACFRIDPREAVSPDRLDDFLHNKLIHVTIPVDLVKKLSPDSMSVIEFRNEKDIQIAERSLTFPLLGDEVERAWNFSLGSEFHMTNDSYLFKTSFDSARLPLYEGKMIHHFTHQFAEPKFWIDHKEGRKALLGRDKEAGQLLGYQNYRIGYRSISSSTNERTMICTLLPKNVFCGNSLNLTRNDLLPQNSLFITTVLSSLTLDYFLRQRVSQNLNQLYIYQLPVPRLTSTDPRFLPIVTRAAKLICTTPDFDDLAAAVGLSDHTNGVTDPAERAKLRAELDGMVAHLYGLTQADFKHILATFPLVATETKDAALQAFKDFAPKQGDTEIAQLITAGESAKLEFKSTARWNVKANMADKKMEEVILKTVAAFWNAEGGTLLIGVEDSGNIYGLDADYKTLGNKGNRDGFELFLTDLLLKDQPELRDYLQVSFHSLEGKDVCRVVAKAASKPVYVELSGVEKFFARVNNSTRELSIKQAHDYIQDHWK
jgi:hypothetical protein